ncbi:MAG: hypothetical protein AAF449_08225 [Myxococcota bacterium]
MTIASGFSGTIQRPQFKVYKSGLKEPKEGQSKFLFSPEILNEDGNRNKLFQANHVTPTKIVNDPRFSEFYNRLCSEAAGTYRYQHDSFENTGKHIWRPDEAGFGTYVSDEFYARYRKAKLTGECLSYCPERDVPWDGDQILGQVREARKRRGFPLRGFR